MKFLLLALTLAIPAAAQHSAALTWTDTQNPSGTTYNIYRSTGTCPATPTIAPATLPLTTGVTVKTYTDTSVVGGTTYCYWGTAVSGGSESAASNTTQAVIPSNFPPTAISVVVR